MDEELHRYWAENLAEADALLFGRVTYEMMEAAWRPPAQSGVRPDPTGELSAVRYEGQLGRQETPTLNPD
jgi:dihydrofolate reductase